MRNPIHELLEKLKTGIDRTHEATLEGWIRGKKVVLHPPASAQAIEKFFASDIGLGFPKSYADFLTASDGMEWMWNGLHFMPAGGKRQAWVIKEAVDQSRRFAARFSSLCGDVNDKAIREWRSKGLVYLPMTTIAAVSPVGDLLLYDHYSQQKNGEMAIGWRPSTESRVTEWFPNLYAWLVDCQTKPEQCALSIPKA